MNDTKQPKKITAAGGIVFRYGGSKSELEVLMIYRNGVWDLPKGKIEPLESISNCAVREVAEEVGSSIPAIVRKVGTTYHEYWEGGELIGKTTHWYSMIFTKKEQIFKPQLEEGIEKVEWFPVGEAIAAVSYENLISIIEEFKK